MIPYRHIQIGYVMIGTLGVSCLFGVYLLLKGQDNFLVILVLVLLLMAGVILFSRLTTVVEGNTLSLWFGPGWPRRTFSLEDVVEVRVTRKPWYAGWGIRRLLHNGWLFNVSGRDVVEMVMKDGRRFLIGSDEPESLAAAIRRTMRHSA